VPFPETTSEKHPKFSRRSLVGLSFCRLTVVSFAFSRHQRRWWSCICECGTPITVMTAQLRNGGTRSCGCLRTDNHLIAVGLRPYEALYKALLLCARRSNQAIAISYEDFLKFTAVNECHYCGEPVFWAKYSPQHHGGKRYNLDRKDNSAGYSLGNVVVCCFPCNSAKGARYSYEEWYVMTKALRQFRLGRPYAFS